MDSAAGRRQAADGLDASSSTLGAYYTASERMVPVWVDLDRFYLVAAVDGDLPEGDEARVGVPRAPQPGGLVLHGEVNGHLHRWCRGTDGRWLGLVSFRIPFASGIVPAHVLERVLLPRARSSDLTSASSRSGRLLTTAES